MTIAVLCEKASAAKNFARALNARQGEAKGTYKGRLDGEQVIVCHARGHLYETPADPSAMVDPEKAERYASWDPECLPWDPADIKWRKEPRKGASDVMKSIKWAFAQADEVCIACDDDPSGEGDLLGWEVVEKVRDRPAKVTRARFADESAPEVLKALRARTLVADKAKDPSYRKALFRDRWDYLSKQFTRAAKAATGETLRQGRVKSACVVLVGDQEKRRADYVRKPYWEVRYKDELGVTYSRKDDGASRRPSKGEAEAELALYGPSPVAKDGTERRRQAPPKLMDLARLSARMARRGLSPENFTKIYQRMYEDGYVSYPRTEDKKVTRGQFDELLPLTDDICRAAGVDPALVCHRKMRPAFIGEGLAHGANRPGQKVPASLAELDERYGAGAGAVWREVALGWLAMLSPDREYLRQHGHVADHPEFVGHSDVTTKAGWTLVLKHRLESEKKDREADADPGEPKDPGRGLGERAEPMVAEGANKRPQAPTMDWLAAQLERRGIGTGATRNAIVMELCAGRPSSPALMARKRNALSLTEAGRVSWQVLPGTHIGSLDSTAQVQAQMAEVAQGADPARHLAQVGEWVSHDLKRMAENAQGAGIEPKARAPRVKLVWRGEEVAVSGFWAGHVWTDSELADLAADRPVFRDDFQGKRGRFAAVVCLERDDKGRVKAGFAPDFKGERAGGPITCPRVTWGRAWTQEEAEALIHGSQLSREFQGRNGAFKALVELVPDPARPGRGKVVRADRISGEFRGRACSIPDTFGGAPIDAEAAAELFAGRPAQVGEHRIVLAEERGRVRIAFAEGRPKRAGSMVEGDWHGERVEFDRWFRGSELTDAEVAAVLQAPYVDVERTTKAGVPYPVRVGLAKSTDGTVGLVNKGSYTGTWKGKELHFSRFQWGQWIDDEELGRVLTGKTIRKAGRDRKGTARDTDLAVGPDRKEPGKMTLVVTEWHEC